MVLGEGDGNPLQYSCLENPMDGGAWGATVHGVEKSRIRLSDFTFTLWYYIVQGREGEVLNRKMTWYLILYKFSKRAIMISDS